MYGYQKTYLELLNESGLQTLKARREKAVLKFAQKATQNPVYDHWFEENPNRSTQRASKAYTEFHANTDRLYRSPLFYMRRALNGSVDDDRNENPTVLNLDHVFNDPYVD